MSQNIEDKNFFILPDVGAIIADIDKSIKSTEEKIKNKKKKHLEIFM